jgi:hypothetical protein
MSAIMIAFAFLAGMVAGIVATFAFAAYLGGKRPRRAARRARYSSAGASPSTLPGDKSVARRSVKVIPKRTRNDPERRNEPRPDPK